MEARRAENQETPDEHAIEKAAALCALRLFADGQAVECRTHHVSSDDCRPRTNCSSRRKSDSIASNLIRSVSLVIEAAKRLARSI
jgi:hypothetical protein